MFMQSISSEDSIQKNLAERTVLAWIHSLQPTNKQNIVQQDQIKI